MQGRVLWPGSYEFPWFTCAERDQAEIAEHRAGVLYKEMGSVHEKPLGSVQNGRILHI
jgi:hypothetical protein